MGDFEYLTCPEHEVEMPNVSQSRADELGIEHGCSAHNAEMRARPLVESMTVDERVAELRAMGGPLYHGMILMLDRMDALVGRPLFTHERFDLDLLEHEIRTGLRPSLAGVITKLLHDDMPVLVVVVP